VRPGWGHSHRRDRAGAPRAAGPPGPPAGGTRHAAGARRRPGADL